MKNYTILFWRIFLAVAFYSSLLFSCTCVWDNDSDEEGGSWQDGDDNGSSYDAVGDLSFEENPRDMVPHSHVSPEWYEECTKLCDINDSARRGDCEAFYLFCLDLCYWHIANPWYQWCVMQCQDSYLNCLGYCDEARDACYQECEEVG